MYERGETEYLDILLQVKSMTELLNKSEYIEALYTYDREKLEEFQETKLQVKQYKAQLENEKAEMEGMQLEYADQQAQLAAAKAEAAAYTATIAKKNEQIRQAQAEEARRRAQAQRAAEEASRQAAEAARLAAQASSAAAESTQLGDALIAQNPGGNPDSGNTQNVQAPPAAETSPSTTAASQGPKAETTKAQTPETTKAPSSSGSGSGQSVANYAMQFIGNPYVYGGTSLTNGADCSGFVQSVYKNFGISLPRSSSQQRSAGTAVDYADAQPGDIVCYAGHVGIYIGNGQIVHASSPSTGIKVGNATYRSILSVRRILN